MSLKSGVPIAPVRFSIARYMELKGWDRKRMPYPFNRIRAEFKDPIQVTEANFDEARERLREALGVPKERGDSSPFKQGGGEKLGMRIEE